MGLNAPFSYKLFSLCKNGHFEALEGRLNVIAPREVSRKGGLGYANQPGPLGGVKHAITIRAGLLPCISLPGSLLERSVLAPPVPLRCTGGYDIDSPLRG